MILALSTVGTYQTVRIVDWPKHVACDALHHKQLVSVNFLISLELIEMFTP